MEVNGYIIPPPMETPQCIKVLTTSPQKNRHPRRCGCRTSQEDLKQAGWLTSELMRQTAEEKPTTIERIILLRVCRNTHRQILKVADQSATLKSLVQAYKESCPDLSPYQTMPRLEEELFEPYRTRSRTNSVQHLLPLKINQEQYKWGWIYIFDWPRAPGFLKIGYAKASAEKRTDKWGLCHPESTLLYHVELAFPERMEKLIHAELADQRHRLRDICSRCKEKHTEWFAVTIEKAQRIARDWSTVAASPLYMEDRTLTQQWVQIIGSLPRVDSSTLSQHLKRHPSADISRSRAVSQQPETSSRSSSISEGIVPFMPSSRHSLEDRQVGGLVAEVDSLTIR